MERTKLGITVGLLAGGIYFSGLISSLVTFGLIVYVLIREDNVWLKKMAVKAGVIIIAFAILSVGVDMLQEIFGVFSVIAAQFKKYISFPLGLDSLLNYVISFLRNATLVFAGFQTLKGRDFRMPVVDEFLNKAL